MFEPNKIYIGDCREEIAKWPEGIVQTCVTSPPYWGLRDYGVEGQLGHEKTPEEYVANMVDVFRAVKRVLREDGTLWVNLGDSYASGGNGAGSDKFKKMMCAKTANSRNLEPKRPTKGLKPKDLVGIPWLVALALRQDGWYLRADIIWSKPSPMPESVTDRPTRSHEYIFLLSKHEKYYYDANAIKEPHSRNWWDETQNKNEKVNRDRMDGGTRQGKGNQDGRNKRTVWEVASQPFSGAHFAPFPPKLIEPCIRAGSRIGDLVLDPFMGSGTTAQVCDTLGRQWVGCDLNPSSSDLLEERLLRSRYDLKGKKWDFTK